MQLFTCLRLGVVLLGSVPFGSVLFCSDWFGSVRFDAIRFVLVWFGLVWFGSVRSIRFHFGLFQLAQFAKCSPVDNATPAATRRHQNWVLLRLAQVLYRGTCVPDLDGPPSVVDRAGQPPSRRPPDRYALKINTAVHGS